MNDGIFKNTKEETKKAGKAVLPSNNQTSKDYTFTTTIAVADITADKTCHREKSAQNDLNEEKKTREAIVEKKLEKRVEIAPLQYSGVENKTDCEV